ncbi:MAG: sigma-54-dependent Fis family transcriptional regulator, partial [Deltaproteobacteria bacterium]|nr:sigma-54-dependent Fis family transcriptional regulator [Deltaproteobacteria bacterium]
FLDEIGDMSIDVQSKLLRAIQEKEFYRVGGKRPVKVDVRFISATNQDLQKLRTQGRFREDLLYRLNVVSIKIPPLRERREDIPMLVDYLLQKFQEETGLEQKALSQGAMEALKAYDWPGNVREMENILKRAALLSPNPVISIDDLALPQGVTERESIEDLISTRLEGFVERIEAKGRQELYQMIMPFMERPLIRLVLKKTKGNQVKAAEILGINRNTLRKKIKELGIKVKDSSQ